MSIGSPKKIEFKLAPTAFQDYKPCPACGNEARLKESGKCFDCDLALESDQKAQERMNQAIIEVLGEEGFNKYTLENFKQIKGNRTAFKAVSEFDCVSTNLYLYGRVGTGKSHLTNCVARKAIELGKSLLVKTVRQVVREIRGRTGEEEDQVIKSYSKAQVLIIEEFGLGGDTEFAIGTICEILDNRFKKGLNGMVFNGNYSLDQLATKLNDARMSSRLTEKCIEIQLNPIDSNGKPIDFRFIGGKNA